jgi:hypothetical protein
MTPLARALTHRLDVQRRPREIETIGATLIGLAREGLPATEARRRLLACGMSEAGADALIQSAGRNLKVSA